MADTPLAPVVRHIHKLAGLPEAADASDALLLERFAGRRDEAAFAALMRRHGPLVWRVCRGVLCQTQHAEEAYQATFLVLARQAAKVRKPAALASWLYAVAYRIARKARADLLLRQSRERQLGAVPAVDPADEAAWRELERIIIEEVHALPEKYRTPILLCYWEGLTNEEAAVRLGWPAGTVKTRLLKARRLLHERLTRRGVSLSAGTVVTLLATGSGDAAMPTDLAASALRLALALARGEGLPAVEASAAAALAQQAIRGATLAKVKIVLVLLLGSAIAAGVGALACHQLIARQPEWKRVTQPSPEAKSEEQPMKRQIRTDRYGDPLPAGALVRLGTMRFRHEGSANSLAFSPDGKVLASTSAGRVILWDASTGRELRRLQVSGEHGLFWLRSLDFSPDGRTLAAIARNQSIYFWDAATGKQIHMIGAALSGAPDPGKETRFSPDGKILAVTDLDKVILFDAKTGKEVFRLGGHRAEINSVAFSPNGKTLALGTLGPAVQIWDLEKGKLLRGIEGHGKNFVYSVAFSRDGKVLASGGWNKIVLTEAATGKELATLEAKKMEAVNALALTPDGKTLISSSSDGQVRFWDVPGRKERLRLDARMAPIEAMALSRDGKTVAVGSYFNVIRLWDVATGKELFQDFHGHNGIIASVAYAPDGKTLAVAGDSGEVILWDAVTGQPRCELKVYRPCGVAFSPDGRRLATVPFSRSFQVWDVATGKELFRIQGKNVVKCVGFSPDGQYLVSAHIGSLILWDPSTGKRLREFSFQTTAHPQSLTFAPDSRTVALGTSDGDGIIRLWDLEAGQEVLVLTGHRDEVESVAFSPDGKLLASGSLDQTVRLWEVASGKEILTLRGHKRAVTSVAFSPDGKVVASGSGAAKNPIWTKEPNKVRFWDVATGKERAPFQGHGTDVTCLAFSPDGSRLASGLRKSTVLLWDTTQAVHALHRVAQLDPKELEALWSDLAGEDARKAHAAIWTLTAIPNQAASFLKGHLHPAASKWDPKQIRRWIVDLDSDRFAVRQETMKKLEQVGEDARPALRRALDSKPSLETRKRLEELLSKPKVLRSGEELRGVRAVEVLEHIGTPGAREVLESLVKGAPEVRQTREAKASLERLDNRKATP